MINEILEKKEEKNLGGRPTLYTDELAQQILDLIKNGKTLMEICEDEKMPCRTTVYYWRDADKVFERSFWRARKRYAESRAEHNIKMVNDLVEHMHNYPEDKFAADKLRAMSDVVKTCSRVNEWQAERFNPKRFSPFQKVESKSKNTTEISLTNVEEVRGKLFDKLTPPPVKVEGVEIMANEIHVNSDETNSGT